MGWMIVDALEVTIGFVFNLFAHHLRHVEDLGHIHCKRIKQNNQLLTLSKRAKGQKIFMVLIKELKTGRQWLS